MAWTVKWQRANDKLDSVAHGSPYRWYRDSMRNARSNDEVDAIQSWYDYMLLEYEKDYDVAMDAIKQWRGVRDHARRTA